MPGPAFKTSQTPTEREAAAIAAVIRRFSSDTAVAPPTVGSGMSPWLRAALVEGVNSADTFGPGDPDGLG